MYASCSILNPELKFYKKIKICYTNMITKMSIFVNFSYNKIKYVYLLSNMLTKNKKIHYPYIHSNKRPFGQVTQPVRTPNLPFHPVHFGITFDSSATFGHLHLLAHPSTSAFHLDIHTHVWMACGVCVCVCVPSIDIVVHEALHPHMSAAHTG